MILPCHDRAVKPTRLEETPLPGIGVRHDVETAAGRRVGVISHRDGLRELVVYDARDPDACIAQVRLTPEEADALAEVLGATRVIERLATLRRQLEGLVTEEIPVRPESPFDGHPLGDTRARTRTGASIVAVIRGGGVIPSPGPEFRFAAGDVVVVVGTAQGTAAVADILTGRSG
jgi:TrkA domain protein